MLTENPGDDEREALEARAQEQLNSTPFKWQLTSNKIIAQGEDLIIDVGTGCGKSLCYQLATLLDPERNSDIVLVVSPLSALMLDQVSSLAWRKAQFHVI